MYVWTDHSNEVCYGDMLCNLSTAVMMCMSPSSVMVSVVWQSAAELASAMKHHHLVRT